MERKWFGEKWESVWGSGASMRGRTFWNVLVENTNDPNGPVRFVRSNEIDCFSYSIVILIGRHWGLFVVSRSRRSQMLFGRARNIYRIVFAIGFESVSDKRRVGTRSSTKSVEPGSWGIILQLPSVHINRWIDGWVMHHFMRSRRNNNDNNRLIHNRVVSIDPYFGTFMNRWIIKHDRCLNFQTPVISINFQACIQWKRSERWKWGHSLLYSISCQ